MPREQEMELRGWEHGALLLGLRAGAIVTYVYLGNFPKHRAVLWVWLSELM